MTDLEAIKRTIVLYAQLLDDGRFEEWGQLFTEDAEFTSSPGSHLPDGSDKPWSVRGRVAIVEAIGALETRLRVEGGLLHFGGPPVIDIAGDTALAWWDFTMLQVGPQAVVPTHAGRYYARLVRGGGRWRFSQRVSVRAGTEPPAGLAPVPPF